MNSVLIFDHEEFKKNHFCLTGKRVEHLKNHLKVQTTELIHVTWLNKGLGQAIIQEIKENEILIQLDTLTPTTPTHIEVMVGLSRPPTMKKIIEHGATLGVARFHFFKAELSDKSYAQSSVLKAENVQKLLELGLSQSRYYAHLPEVHVHSHLPTLATKQRFFLDQNAPHNILKSSIQVNHPALFAFGPERVWSEKELDTLKERGFQGIRLAPTTLRIEHAFFALMGQYHMINSSNS